MLGIYVGSKANLWLRQATQWTNIFKIIGRYNDFPRDLNDLIHKEGLRQAGSIDVLVLNLPRNLTEDQLSRLNDLAAYYLKAGGLFYSRWSIPPDSRFQPESRQDDFFVVRRLMDDSVVRQSGLVFCHGRDHRSLPLDFLILPVDWIYVDKKPDARPDIVGDVFKTDLPTVDIILTMACSARGKLDKLVRRAAELLRPGGRLYFDVLISFLLTEYRTLYPADYAGLPGIRPNLLSEKQLREGHPAITRYVDDRVAEFPMMVRFTKG